MSEVILQLSRIGNALRVTAIHADTGTEIVFQAPATTSQNQIKQLAHSKLKYVLEKKRQSY